MVSWREFPRKGNLHGFGMEGKLIKRGYKLFNVPNCLSLVGSPNNEFWVQTFDTNILKIV